MGAKSLKEGGAAALKKTGGFFGEFKAFISRGNVMDLAVGVIIGGAFQGIVTALTADFINPLISSIGGAEVAGSIRLPWVDYDGMTLEEVQSMSLNYGDFITAIINFLIMAFIIFILMKSINKLMSLGKKAEEPAPEEPAPKPDDVVLLEEIRDLLKQQNGSAAATAETVTAAAEE